MTIAEADALDALATYEGVFLSEYIRKILQANLTENEARLVQIMEELQCPQ